LIERYRGLVEGMARAIATRLPASVDVQDLIHAGIWGLMQSLDGFRPERGAHFVSFMRARVRGAMLDELRNLDHLPRLLRQRLRARDAATARLRSVLDREPSDAEVAEELGVSEAQFRQNFATLAGSSRAAPVRRRGVDDVEPPGFEDELPAADREHPIENLYRQDLLAKIEASLQPIEWLVLRLHYLEGVSGKEIARRLRLSPSRICQIHGRVLSKLKAKLRES
jgi:RNA polymerase sigma factor for flagellar operon FliA